MTSFPLTRALSRGATLFIVLLAAVAIVVPMLNLMLPPSSPYHISSYYVALFGKYLCFALLALSIDLIWGYCGILSLGHGAFFALGGYAMGMYLMRQIGTRGVYANPTLPDFMVFLNWTELPVYWYGFQWFPYAMLMVLLVPGALAFVFGWFAFRSRVTGVYLSIITQRWSTLTPTVRRSVPAPRSATAATSRASSPPASGSPAPAAPYAPASQRPARCATQTCASSAPAPVRSPTPATTPSKRTSTTSRPRSPARTSKVTSPRWGR
jgi:hypothetical protein